MKILKENKDKWSYIANCEILENLIYSLFGGDVSVSSIGFEDGFSYTFDIGGSIVNKLANSVDTPELYDAIKSHAVMPNTLYFTVYDADYRDEYEGEGSLKVINDTADYDMNELQEELNTIIEDMLDKLFYNHEELYNAVR